MATLSITVDISTEILTDMIEVFSDGLVPETATAAEKREAAKGAFEQAVSEALGSTYYARKMMIAQRTIQENPLVVTVA